MTKSKLIKILMSYGQDKPREFWESLDEDTLNKIYQTEKASIAAQVEQEFIEITATFA